MLMPFRIRRRQSYPWWFALAIATASAGFFSLPETRQTPEFLLSLLGSIAAFFHFLYSQYQSNTERFAALFKDFNERFDRLNDSLNRVRSKQSAAPLEASEFQVLYDYFNLCAEEYLYYKAGYIDQDVWSSWLRGMAHFTEHDGIRTIWARELEQGSYYGFTLELLASATQRAPVAAEG